MTRFPVERMKDLQYMDLTIKVKLELKVELTIIISRILVGWTWVLDEGEVWKHFAPLPVIHQTT
jgi:hypothetical protein